jgi:hypothetical protein
MDTFSLFIFWAFAVPASFLSIGLFSAGKLGVIVRTLIPTLVTESLALCFILPHSSSDYLTVEHQAILGVMLKVLRFVVALGFPVVLGFLIKSQVPWLRSQTYFRLNPTMACMLHASILTGCVLLLKLGMIVY